MKDKRVKMVLPDGKTTVMVKQEHVELRKKIGWKVVEKAKK